MSEESSVERLRKKLYARGKGPEQHARRTLHEDAYEVRDDWTSQDDLRAQQERELEPEEMLESLRAGHVPGQHDQTPGILTDERVSPGAIQEREKRRMTSRIIRTIFFASALFFFVAAGIAVYFWVSGNGQISCDHMKIVIRGPVSVASGDELVLSVNVLNNNPITLQDTELVMEYPEGTRSPENTSVNLPTIHQVVGEIKPGEQVRATSRAVLFGPEHTEQTVNATVEYHIADSDATFTCEAPYRIQIATAPVSLHVEGLEEISSGQQLELTVNITSNSREVVPDQRLVVEYPFGYEFIRAAPEPTNSSNVWDIGDIAPGSVHTIKITGVVSAQSVETRAVKLQVGQQATDSSDKLATILQAVDHQVHITRPFLEMQFAVNDSTEKDVAVNVGQSVNGVLGWINTLPYPVYDVQIEATLPGQLVDARSVHVNNGYFRSVDRTILWTPQTDNTLKEIDPGQKGSQQFQFTTAPFVEDTSATNPFIDMAFTVHARRVSDDVPVEQTLVAQAQKTIKLNTNFEFIPLVVYGIGPFTNTGPYPPRVDQETTYTVIWNIKNTTNDLGSVKVVGELPVYVTWLGATDPTNELLAYNPTTHKVTWLVGDVPASTGYQKQVRQVSFQISYTPSISQIGVEPALITAVTATAVDRFTNSVIERSVREQTTRLTNDPYFSGKRANVVP